MEKEENFENENLNIEQKENNANENSNEINIECTKENENSNSENIKDNEESENITEKEDEKLVAKQNTIRNIIFHIVAIICIAIFCSAEAPKTLQNDTFYTIPIGEYIYNNGVSDLTTDNFSWHELPYTYPHWLYDLMMFVIYNSFGQLGIYVSTMVLASILGISIYGLSNKKSKNKVVSFAIAIGSIYLMRSFIAARAQLLTFILFVWTVYFIEKLLEKERLRYAIPLIIIPLLIANLHCAVFPFYFVLFLPYIGEYLLSVFVDLDIDLRIFTRIIKIFKKLSRKEEVKEKYSKRIEKLQFVRSERKRKRNIIRENPYKIKGQKNHIVLLLIAIMIIAFGTGILNPAGDGAYTYLVKTMNGNTMDSINEHLPLTLVDNYEFAISIVLFLLILIFTDTKIRLHDLFMLVGLTILSFYSRRQVSIFAIICGPILAMLIGKMIEKYDRETFIKIEKFISGWFGSIVITCLFIILGTNIIKPHLRSDYIDKTSYPVEASDWILSNLNVNNIKIYNEYNYGSYLLFRGIPVFIDSRCDLYSPEFNEDKENGKDGRDIFADALNIPSLSVNYENKFEEYGVTHVILYSNAKLAMVLENDSNYKQIYNEGNFKIFERLSTNEK